MVRTVLQFNTIDIQRRRFHGEWNYLIYPRKSSQLNQVIFVSFLIRIALTSK